MYLERVKFQEQKATTMTNDGLGLGAIDVDLLSEGPSSRHVR